MAMDNFEDVRRAALRASIVVEPTDTCHEANVVLQQVRTHRSCFSNPNARMFVMWACGLPLARQH